MSAGAIWITPDNNPLLTRRERIVARRYNDKKMVAHSFGTGNKEIAVRITVGEQPYSFMTGHVCCSRRS